jgi:2,4-dienoyl-CoA reductase (NADPH2)
MSCAVNAQAGREREYTIQRAPKAKKVFILGGGPAGMEAARVAALRGHQVTLFEAKDRLGGQVLYAAIPPHKDELKTTIGYLTAQLEKLKVKVKLNAAPTAKEIIEGKPDVVIIATGAIPLIPDWPGIEGPNVVTAIDVLAGRKQTGRNVVIVGSGCTGCETAEFLAEKGKQVTILEMLPRIGTEYGPTNRFVIIDRLVAARVRLETGVKAEAITKSGVRIIRGGLYSEFFEADSVVLAIGTVRCDAVAGTLEGKVPSVFKIGDAAKPAGVTEAMESAFRIALQI